MDTTIVDFCVMHLVEIELFILIAILIAGSILAKSTTLMSLQEEKLGNFTAIIVIIWWR